MLYVVDSVIRQWVEKAKKAGQAVSKQAAPGTFASGVQLVREALPVVLQDLVKNAPETHKEKISKLLDIWQRGQTFPPDMIASMKQLVNGTSNSKSQASIAFVLLTDTVQMLQPRSPVHCRATARIRRTTAKLTNSLWPLHLLPPSNHNRTIAPFMRRLQA